MNTASWARLRRASSGLVAAAALIAAGCQHRRGQDITLPEGFSGWACIEYEVTAAPPLTVVGGRYQIRVPESGKVRTSSQLEGGTAQDRVYTTVDGRHTELQFYPGGVGQRVWAMQTLRCQASQGPERIFGAFFVGDETDWRKQPSPATSCCGP